MTQQQTPPALDPGALGAPATARQARTGPMPTTGRWGWYRDHEGNEYRRVSTLIKKVETDNFNLEKWQRRQVAEGLAIRDDLVLSIKAMGRPADPVEGWSYEDKRKLDGIIEDAQRAAKQRDGGRAGTAVHDLTERLDRGESVEDVVRGLPAPAARSLRAYDYLRRANGWRSVEIERTVVNDDVRAAGTFDRVDLVPGLAALLGPGDCQYGHGPGEHFGAFMESGHSDELPVVVDVKTEKAPWLNGLHIGPQMGIYSRSRRMWSRLPGEHPLLDDKGNPKVYERSGDTIMIPNGEYVPAPCVRQDLGIVVHVHDGDAVPLFINLVEGWDAATAAYEQMERESRAKRKMGVAGAWFVPVPNVVRPKPAELFVQEQAAKNIGAASTLAAAEQVQVGDTVTVGGIEFTKPAELPTGAELVGGHGPMPGPAPAPVAPLALQPEPVVDESGGELARMLIAAIRQAASAEQLSALWTSAQEHGVPWRGPVETAGAARLRQVQCVQRAAHGGSTLKCACGWARGLPA